MEHQKISLATKPGAFLHISTLFPDPSDRPNGPLENVLVVFLNGLILSRETWFEAIDQLIESRHRVGQPLPALLSYDRYGQGDSDPDPNDPQDTAYGHDAMEVITDLHQLLEQVSRDYLRSPLGDLAIAFVCNSIGCPLARLYAAEHPGSVSAVLFLDSMMANTDFVSLFPDPDHVDFDPGKLPSNVSVRDIQHARERFAKLFHPTVANPEHFDRRNLSQLLPHADRPNLPSAPGGHSPRLVVVGHDLDEFARQCEEVRYPEDQSFLPGLISHATIHLFMFPQHTPHFRQINNKTHTNSPFGTCRARCLSPAPS